MSNDRNAWTKYYESTVSPRAKARGVRVVQSEKQAPKVLRGAEKAQAEDNAQLRRYRRAKAAEYKRALEGPTGNLFKDLHEILKHLDIDNDPATLFALAETIKWAVVDTEYGYIALGMINDAIMRLRVQNGLAPIDDSLPGEDPTVFEVCRARLGIK